MKGTVKHKLSWEKVFKKEFFLFFSLEVLYSRDDCMPSLSDTLPHSLSFISYRFTAWQAPNISHALSTEECVQRPRHAQATKGGVYISDEGGC